jgi:hypothetical protein
VFAMAYITARAASRLERGNGIVSPSLTKREQSRALVATVSAVPKVKNLPASLGSSGRFRETRFPVCDVRSRFCEPERAADFYVGKRGKQTCHHITRPGTNAVVLQRAWEGLWGVGCPAEI